MTLAVAAVIVVHLPSVQRSVANRMTTVINERTCLSVELEFLKYRLWPAGLTLRGITVSDSTGRSFTVDHVDASWAWTELIGATPRLRSLEIEGLDLDIFSLPVPCSDASEKTETDPWKALAVDNLTITRTGVSGENEELAFSWTGLQAQATLTEGHLNLQAASRSLGLRRDGRTLEIGPLKLRLAGTPKGLDLKSLVINGGPIEIKASGSSAGDATSATGKLSATLSLDEILHWWDPEMAALVDPRGPLGIVGDLNWDINSGLRSKVRLNGQPVALAGYTFSRLEAVLEQGRLEINGADPSWGRVDINLNLAENLEINVQLDQADPMPALARTALELPKDLPTPSEISGHLEAHIPLPIVIADITAVADLKARWDGGWAHLRGSADHGIIIEQASGRIFGADLEASGTIGDDGTLDIRGALQIPKIAETLSRAAVFLPEFESPALAGGPVKAEFELGGSLDTPRIDSRVLWDEALIEGFRLQSATARVQGDLDHLEWSTTADANGAQLIAEGTASPGSGSLRGRWRLEAEDLKTLQQSVVNSIEPTLTGSIAGGGEFQIDAESWNVTARIDGNDISNGQWSIPHLVLEAQADPDCASITSVKVDVFGGRIEGRGHLCPAGTDGTIQGVIDITDLDLSQIQADVPETARGLIDGRLEFGGTLPDPSGTVRLSWKSITADVPLESAVILAQLEDGRITIVSEKLETISGPLNLRADLPLGDLKRPEDLWSSAPSGPWRLSIEGHDLALAPLFANLHRPDLKPEGSCNLALDVSWLPDQRELPQAHLDISDFEATIAGRRITTDSPLRLALDDRGVLTADIALKDELNRLILGGAYNLRTSEIDASIDGILDSSLAALAPFPVTIHSPITFNGQIEGPTGARVGHLKMAQKGGSMEMRDPPLEITDASIEARWADGTLEITDGSARVNRGKINFGGAWDPDSGQGLIAELEDVTALLPGGIVTRWDGVLALEPASDRLASLTGVLNLKYGAWDTLFDLGAAVRGDESESGTDADDITHRIGLDLDIRGGGAISVDNNLGRFDVRWNTLEIGGTVAQPEIIGDLNLLPGGVVTAAGQPMTIRRGMVQFTGDPLTDPLLEIIPEDRNTSGLGGSGDASRAQASSLAAAGLASGLGAVFGLQNTTIRPEEIAMETDEDTSTDFSIGQELTHNTALFLTTDLRNSQKRTTLLQLWRLPSLPGLTVQAMTRTDPGEADIKLLQRFHWGGTLATGDQPRLHKVRLEGEWPWSKRRLRKATGLVRDQPWDPFFLFLGDIRLEKKLAEKGWPEARVESRIEGRPERPIAVFEVTPGRHVDFQFEGDPIAKNLRSGLHALYRFPPLETPSLHEMERMITRHLWAQSFPNSEVSILSDGEGLVTISIVKGEEKTLVGPLLEGVPEDAVPALEMLLGRATELTEIAKDPTRAERVVKRTLATFGYRNVASVESWTAPSDDGGLEVHLQIDPGERARATVVDLVGADPLGLTDTEDFPIRTNMILDRQVIDGAVASLRRSYRKEGFTEARVRAQIYQVNEEQWGLLLTLDPGSTATIDSVTISGQRHLKEAAILKGLTIHPEEVFLLDDLDDSVARLATFEPIDRVTATVDRQGDGVVANLDIIEKPRWTTEIGGGWNSDRGATARIGFADNNLFGRGVRLGFRGRWEDDFLQGRIIVAIPPLPGGRLSLGLNASYTEDILPAEFEGDIVINEHIRETTLEGHYRLGPGLWTRSYYRFSRTRTFEEDPFDPDFALDITQDLAVLGSQIVIDRLDNPFDPRNGFYGALDLSWAGEAIGSDKENVRGLMTGSLASEPINGWTWFQSLRLGAAKPLNGVLDRQSRFFAGGSASIRGFKLDSVGPVENFGGITIYAGGEALFVLNEELRFPLWQALRGAVFVDTGQVWETWSDATFDLSIGAGVGLRWSTPVGPLWVDAAWPIANRGENSGARYSFGIGRTF